MQMQAIKTAIVFISTIFFFAIPCIAQESYVVRITASNCAYGTRGTTNILTGFFLKDRGIMTALHGVCGCKTIAVEDAGGRDLGRMKVSSVDLDNDVALLTSESGNVSFSSGFETSNVSTSQLANQNVIMIGFGHGVSKPKTSTIARVRNPAIRSLIDCVMPTHKEKLSERNSPNVYNEVLDVEIPIAPGCSGAPIIYNGKVIGVADGGLEKGTTNYCWAIPINSITLITKSSSEPRYSELAAKNPENIFVLTSVNSASNAESNQASIPMDMAGADMVSATKDEVGSRQELIINRFGRKGGFNIESRYPDRRQNGTLFMKKTFDFGYGYKSFQLDIGQGQITSYDRNSNQIQTSSNLKRIWGDKFTSEEYSKISKLTFQCNVYLGELNGSIENNWETKNAVIFFGTSGSEQTQNPRAIYSPKKDRIELNGNSSITCICRFYDARKDDYHLIQVPYALINLNK